MSILGTIKNLNKINLTTPKKVTNYEWSGPHELSKSCGLSSREIMWPNPVTFNDLFFVLLYLSHQDLSDGIDDVTIGVSVRLFLSMSFSASFSFYVFFFFHLLVICEERWEREKSKKKETDLWDILKLRWWHHMDHKKRSRQEKSNSTRKGHQCWPKWATWSIQRYMSLATFGRLLWPTIFIVSDLS